MDIVRSAHRLHIRQRGADEVMVVTTGSFTADATAFANGKPIWLMDGPELWQMVREVQCGTKEQAQTNLAPPPEVRHAVVMNTTSSPACPLCASLIVRRTARRGVNAGSVFWGCQTFTVCKGVRN